MTLSFGDALLLAVVLLSGIAAGAPHFALYLVARKQERLAPIDPVRQPPDQYGDRQRDDERDCQQMPDMRGEPVVGRVRRDAFEIIEQIELQHDPRDLDEQARRPGGDQVAAESRHSRAGVIDDRHGIAAHRQ